MAYGYTPPRGRSTVSLLLVGFVILIVGGVATVGTLWGLGVIPELFGKKAGKPSHEGMIAVPVSAIDIAATSVVTRDHLIDKEAKELKLIYVKPEELKPEMIRDPAQIIGRVMKRDKKPGYAFTERDFYPVGTQAGITAAIPPNKRSFVFEAEKVKGIAALRPGDRFDIVGAFSLDDKKNSASASPKDLINSAMVVSPTGQLVAPKRAKVHALVSEGIVLTPIVTRQVAVTTASITAGAQPRTKPVQEITIALDPSEIFALTEALKLDETLICVARSGQPLKEIDRPLPEPSANKNPLPAVTVKAIETIVNGKREVLLFGERGEPLSDEKTEAINVKPRDGQLP